MKTDIGSLIWAILGCSIFVLTVLGGVGLLTLAVWPGMIEDSLFEFPFFCISLPFFSVCFIMLVGMALYDLAKKPEAPAKRRWWGLRSAVVMFVTLGLLWFHVPQRIAFSYCSNDLRELVENAPSDQTELNWKVGAYKIDRYAADTRGGVFFRTATGPDGIGPDQMSYGFTFRPNRQGTPFGRSKYSLVHLFGDWYAFSASNDF